ncbi:MAG: EAL domain-containing protein [Thauera sp.]
MTPLTHTIVIVDDDPLQLKLLTHQLGNTGVEATIDGHISATAALEHVRTLSGRKPLIMLDLNMPEMDGIVFLRQLAERDFDGKVLLVSGEDERILETAERLATAYRIDVVGGLTKPVQPKMLAAMLERWVNTRPEGRHPTPPERGFEFIELVRAIQNDELLNHYQPKVDLHTGACVGIEALVRWQHPDHGLVFPDAFVAKIEECGLIDDMTRAVLLRAAADMRVLHGHGLRLRMGINVSMDNLHRLAFPEFVCAALDDASLSPTDLILEVTESRLGHDPVAALDILTRLRLRHIGVSIDDFGTGHSSLRQLRDLPFDELKIDRGFVTGARDQPVRKAIFSGCLDMARELRIHTVAEGVETRDDWDFVRASGCTQAQGYFISRPIPAAALPAWHADWLRRCEELIP